MLKFIVKHPISVFLAVLLHVTLITLFSIKWLDQPETIKISSDGEANQEIKQITQLEPMKTFTVDASQVKAQLEKIKAEQDAKLLEQKNLKAQTAEERQRLQELKKKQQAEKAKAEKAKLLAEEQKRKADAQRKKTEEQKRLARIEKQKADAERKKAQQAQKAALDAEKKTKEAKQKAALAEKQRQAEEQKKQELQKELAQKAEEKKALEKAALEAKKKKEQEQAAADLQRQLDEEAAQQREAQKRKQMLTLKETYISSITAKVKDNWRTPARISPDAQCDLNITQSPSGNITSVKVLNCNKFASKQFKEAAEKAVYRAEPLPAPPVKELFEREITFQFKP
ncbi:cell envelope integrity protein TolA [Thiomicrorhabdus sp.]|uniref:cell envelope integrity protein TolA n=1 Tax=Thiomicrorhabdus sp. TaxID=2039724 RepID=UPI002AA93432|nr:cell envelope integrity protein TolA [Thiomicrorhabdus sp.]